MFRSAEQRGRGILKSLIRLLISSISSMIGRNTSYDFTLDGK